MHDLVIATIFTLLILAPSYISTARSTHLLKAA